MTLRTANQKIADWYAVYSAVEAELNPVGLQSLTTIEAMDQETPATLSFKANTTRVYYANKRAAAIVAAILTSSGVRTVPLESDEPE